MEILAIEKEKLLEKTHLHGFVGMHKADFLELLTKEGEYLDKEFVEGNYLFKQPVLYLWLCSNKKVFLYRKENNYYYHNKQICGGVIRNILRCREFSNNPILDSICDSISKTAGIEYSIKPKLIGFILDNKGYLGENYVGIVGIIEIDNEKKIKNIEMKNGEFYSMDEVDSAMLNNTEVEDWTKISWPHVKKYLMERD